MDQSKDPDHPSATDLPELERASGLAAEPGSVARAAAFRAVPSGEAGLDAPGMAAPFDPLQRGQALRAFSALSHGDRLDLIRLLVPAGPDGLAAGEIARLLGLSASRLSFHLSQLEQAGLLTARKVARNVFYAVDPAGVGAAISHLLNDCCAEHPEVIACCQGNMTRAGPPQSGKPVANQPITDQTAANQSGANQSGTNQPVNAPES